MLNKYSLQKHKSGSKFFFKLIVINEKFMINFTIILINKQSISRNKSLTNQENQESNFLAFPGLDAGENRRRRGSRDSK